MMFNFALKHVPRKTHLATDALLRHSLTEGEEIIEDNDEWLNDIAPYIEASNFTKLFPSSQARYTSDQLPSHFFIATICLDNSVKDIYRFLMTLEAPPYDNPQDQKRFIQKATHYFVKDGKMWKRRRHMSPLLVILDQDKRLAILTQVYEDFGHRGEQAMLETVR
jgi:hypothetical protein